MLFEYIEELTKYVSPEHADDYDVRHLLNKLEDHERRIKKMSRPMF